MKKIILTTLAILLITVLFTQFNSIARTLDEVRNPLLTSKEKGKEFGKLLYWIFHAFLIVYLIKKIKK